MPLTPGTRIGVYEVIAAIGSGGMGEVYRARDTKLNRDVALKVLPDVFADDPERLARFQREAQVLASLNHPNIAAIHGLEESAGVRALVLELVEGPTLAELIAVRAGRAPAAAATSESARRGAAASGGGAPRALEMDEALAIARQIAEALEAAHEQGVIHRDLKPANVKVKPGGLVKVLDFGLAKALDPVAQGFSPADRDQSPTMTAAASRMGVVMGTAAYMSPEQARGKKVDKRADIWAFGCVLYEMLTGRRAFEGEEVTDILASVLKTELDWKVLPTETPAGLRKVLRRCLEKDPKRRLRDIGDLLFEMDEPPALPPTEPVAAVPVARSGAGRRTLLGTIAGLVVGAIVTGFAVWSLRPLASRPLARFVVTAPPSASLSTTSTAHDLAISPDGRRIVYAAGGNRQLYVRPVDQLEGTAIRGIQNAHNPFISPDGGWVGFADGVQGVWKKVSILGGPSVTLCDLEGQSRGASWGPDDTIILTTAAPGSGLFRVPAAGGEPQALTTPDPEKGERFHWWPEVLPGGKAVLFAIVSGAGAGNMQIGVLNLETGEQSALVQGGSHPHYSATGHIVYGVAGTLRAVPFDLDRLEVTGDPLPVLEGVIVKGTGAADFGISRDGTLVYVTGDPQGGAARTLVWVDRQGREEPVAAEPRAYTYPRISPDGDRVALDVRDQEGDVWIWDFARETLTRLTFDPANDYYPLWTPDGQRVAFASARDGGSYNLFWKPADGTGQPERLTESSNTQFPYSWSTEGTQLVFFEGTRGGGVRLLSMEGNRSEEPLLDTEFGERNAEVSPDGNWIAYQSDASGRFEVYVQPFPAVDEGRWQISTGGGTRPLWAPTGRELFYLDPDGRMIVVPIDAGSTLTAGNPEVLFQGQYAHPAAGRTYDISPDGTRFLMIKEAGLAEEGAAPDVIIVEGWFEELERIVPTS